MPSTLNYPGVYVEEIPSGVHTITGVATSITAFVGRAPRGPANQAVTLNSVADFQRIFGGLWVASALGFSVQDSSSGPPAARARLRCSSGARHRWAACPRRCSVPRVWPHPICCPRCASATMCWSPACAWTTKSCRCEFNPINDCVDNATKATDADLSPGNAVPALAPVQTAPEAEPAPRPARKASTP